MTHKGYNQDNSRRAVRSNIRISDYKVNDLAFTDEISRLEKAQRQLDK